MALPNVFSPGQVFTAANANLLRSNQYNQTVTTKTASYTPTTTTDIGTRVIMNSASATTITINTSIYTAGDTFFISNIGVGVCTLTAGTCTITSAGPLAIPQNGGGLLYFTSASAAIYYPTAVTVAAPAASALTFITSAQVTSQSAVDVTSVFNSTYNNYLLLLENVQSSLVGYMLKFRYGTGTADTNNTYLFAANGAGANFDDEINLVAADISATESAAVWVQIFSPNLATATGSVSICSTRNADQPGFTITGQKQTTVQYTSLHFVAESGSTQSFKYTLYGYSIS